MIKLIGAALIVFSGGFFGYIKLAEMRSHTRILDAFALSLDVIKNEICERQTALPKIFETLSTKKPEALGDFYAKCSEAINNGELLHEVWSRQVLLLPLSENEKSALMPLSDVLGKFDPARQAASLLIARQSLEAHILQSKEKENRSGKNLLGLGISMGAMVAIILM